MWVGGDHIIPILYFITMSFCCRDRGERAMQHKASYGYCAEYRATRLDTQRRYVSQSTIRLRFSHEIISVPA